MDERKVKNISRASFAKKIENNHSKDQGEPRQKDLCAENKVSKHGKMVEPKSKAENKLKEPKLLTSGSIKSTRGKNNCRKNASKQEMPNSSILDSASVSHLASPGLCRFACSDCTSTFTSWKCLQAHLKNNHKKSTLARNVEAYLFKASVHICQICSMKVLCDNQFLSKHFLKYHDMMLSKYRQKYNCNSVKNIHKTQLYKTMESAKLSKDVIGNLCTFRCPGCKKQFYSKASFTNHCNPKIGNCQQIVQDTVDFRSSIEEVVTHQCKICFKLLLCDISTIRSHAKNAHDIKTIKEYVRKTCCTFKTHECNQDGGDILNLKEAKFSTQIGHFCTYSCHDCDYNSKRWIDMRSHLKKFNHGSSNSAWHKYITGVVLHQCKICKKNILNDCQFLTGHIHHHHQMSVSDYKKAFSMH